MGNGVVPIKEAFALDLHARGWDMEVLAFGRSGPGEFDAARLRDGEWSTFVEWETGNISSSHRSLNRLVLALMRGVARQGVLALSDAKLYPFLTDDNVYVEAILRALPRHVDDVTMRESSGDPLQVAATLSGISARAFIDEQRQCSDLYPELAWRPSVRSPGLASHYEHRAHRYAS
jgi:hypothetical protein